MGNFYILRPSGHQRDEIAAKVALNQWIHSFLASVVESEKSLKSGEAERLLSLGLPDIQFISNDDLPYSVEHPGLEEFFKSLHFSPLQFRWRFSIFSDVHLLGPIILNKMLKTLEGPPPRNCIFFLNAQDTAILPTIESRAITLTIDEERSKKNAAPSPFSSMIQFISDNNSSLSIVELIQKGEISEQQAIAAMANDLQERGEFRDLCKAIELIKALEQQQTFNNRLAYRLAPLIAHWQNCQASSATT